MHRLMPLLLLALALPGCDARAPLPANDAAPAPALSTVPLTIEGNGRRHALTVEVAVTEAEQEQGLMHRATLPADRGMVFPFAFPKMASFWMKNTPEPLDLLFVRPDGTIAAIDHGKQMDLTPLSANEPVSAVVEIAGGGATRLGVRVGDRVRWGDCAQGQAKPGEAINPLAFCP